jgi:lipopolysaccharide export system protein LptA
VVYESSSEVHLFGRVDYLDPTRTLTSDYATYSSVTARLYATGNVVFTDQTRGSTLRGPELEYYRAIPGRPDAQVIAPQRPHLTVVPTNSQSGNREPLEIDADRITTVGENFFSAAGAVVIHRSDLDATAAEAFHDSNQEFLRLQGDARIRGERFDLAGETVEATLPGGSVDRVVSRENAELVSERLRVDGHEIQLFFADDLLQRLVTRRSDREGAEQPIVSARAFRMTADSLEALLPGQVLAQVTAIGNAHGETVDTARVPATPDGEGVRQERREAGANLLAGDVDWVMGDTLIGYFEPADSVAVPALAAADSAAGTPEEEVVLKRVVALGSARSLYRVQEEAAEDAVASAANAPALNYLVGDEIELLLAGGEMEVAHVRGLHRGVYLDPAPPAPPTETTETTQTTLPSAPPTITPPPEEGR